MSAEKGVDFDGLLVDLDGVVWVGDRALPGASEAVQELRDRGVALMFLTNDPTGSRTEYAARLAGVGVVATRSEIVTSGSALASVIPNPEGVGSTVFVVGSSSLKAELAEAGLTLLDNDRGRDADVVAVGAHSGFDYDELRVAAQAVRRGATLYGAGRDATFPMPDGPWPATGSILAAVETAAGATAVVVGKPEPLMFDLARSALPHCSRLATVGDDLRSDIAGGRRAGLATILVLTGTSTRRDLEGDGEQPDVVVEDLAELARLCATARDRQRAQDRRNA